MIRLRPEGPVWVKFEQILMVYILWKASKSIRTIKRISFIELYDKDGHFQIQIFLLGKELTLHECVCHVNVQY